MCTTTSGFVALAGRVLLGLIFVVSGIGKFASWSATAAFMESKGIPMVPVSLGVAATVELVCGAAVLAGWFTRPAALLLALFLVPATVIFHHFWDLDGQAAQDQMIHFMKNLSIMGGLLTLAAHGPGRISVDESCCRVPAARTQGGSEPVVVP
ncbi:MAG: DoxX protein [Gemmataceae bacterium]|nr:DoxX protein [Gemmataceae bacterium]